jgi:hypothetical protein
MAEYGSEGFRGGKSVMKNSTVYNRAGYRAAPDIYETDPETGNLRQTSGAPRAAGTTPADTNKPAFANVYADTPRPQGGSLAGSLAKTALTKAAEKGLPSVWNSLTNEDVSALPEGGYNVPRGGITSDMSDGIGSQANTVSRTPDFLTGDTSGMDSAGDWAGDFAGGAAAAIGGATTDVAGNAIGWGLDGAAGDAVGAATGVTSGVPIIGPVIQLAQGNVGGAAGSVIGGMIAGPVGAAIGGLVGGRVICTELHAQGLLDADLYALDVAYTPGLHPAVVRGYHWWAIPYVRLMRRSSLATRIARPLATWRAKAIAYELGKGPFSWRGAVVRAIGEPLCFAIGLFVPASDWTQLYAGGSR